jgi:hypothetical protein
MSATGSPGSSLSADEVRSLARLRAELTPFTEAHRYGSLRIDLAEVRLIVRALGVAISSPAQVPRESSREDP